MTTKQTHFDYADVPLPADDWIVQKDVAVMLGVTAKTASLWAGEGKLRIFEHGVQSGGRRKYSRALVRRELEQRWAQAVQQLDHQHRVEGRE
jgi:hypothetical protein